MEKLLPNDRIINISFRVENLEHYHYQLPNLSTTPLVTRYRPAAHECATVSWLSPRYSVKQSGSRQSGSRQSGSRQSGSRQSGSRQSGSRQPGSRQSGSRKTGSRQSGSRQSGSRQSGSRRDTTHIPTINIVTTSKDTVYLFKLPGI